MNLAFASAPGKVILLGEHSVVFGSPALAAALPFGVEVRAFAEGAGGVRIDPPWEGDARVGAALAMLSARSGVTHARLAVASLLPPGAGLGSSGAFGVAAYRALVRLSGREPFLEELLDAVQETETLFHGRASGVDHTTSAVGGLLSYWKGPPRRIEPIQAGKPLTLVLGLTGRLRPTSRHVTSLAARVEAEPARFRPIVDRLGELARVGAGAVVSGDVGALGALMDEAHARLSECELSSPELDTIVRAARGAGARGAKLTGAGGGGAAVALVDEPGDVVRAIEAAGFEARVAVIGRSEVPS